MYRQYPLNFNATLLTQCELHCYAHIQGLKQGRRLYFINVVQNQDNFWLKTQLKQTNHHYEQCFLHELAVYSLLNQQSPELLLPFQVIDPLANTPDEKLGYPCLLLQHAESLFAESASSLMTAQIQHKMLQALDVLERLHQVGWIHGDLKPQHFVLYQSKAKLIDFEQSQQTNLSQTRASTQSATPRYMAPELFHAEPKTLSSDIYALGIIFYEWLTEQRLFAQSYHDWAVLHCQSLKIQLPSAFLGFQSLLESMLVKQKTHRECDISRLKMRLVLEIG